MLRYMSLNDYSDKIQKAIFHVLEDGECITKDLGGNATLTEYTNAIIRYI